MAKTAPWSPTVDEIAETGVWLDLSTNEIVTAEPSEGVQFVAPGAVVTAAVVERVAAYRAAYRSDSA